MLKQSSVHLEDLLVSLEKHDTDDRPKGRKSFMLDAESISGASDKISLRKHNFMSQDTLDETSSLFVNEVKLLNIFHDSFILKDFAFFFSF